MFSLLHLSPSPPPRAGNHPGWPKPDGPGPWAPSGEETLTSAQPHLLNPVLSPPIAELAAVFKTDAALSRVLPNPWSPAGYFPLEAIYLFPFRSQLLSLISGFISHVGRSSVFPTLPNHWCWAWGQTPPWGGEAALGAGAVGEGVAGLY